MLSAPITPARYCMIRTPIPFRPERTLAHPAAVVPHRQDEPLLAGGGRDFNVFRMPVFEGIADRFWAIG